MRIACRYQINHINPYQRTAFRAHAGRGILRRVAAALIACAAAASTTSANENMELICIPSGLGSLNMALRHLAASGSRAGAPVLILHGATFPSANAAAWKIGGRSWMNDLAESGFDVYALDFLGYGESDRYPEMLAGDASGPALGDVDSMVAQVEHAVAGIIAKRPGVAVNLVAHSAATLVAGRYAELHPDRVARLVMFGAPAPSDSKGADDPPSVRFFQVSANDQLDAFEPRVKESGRLDPGMFAVWAAAYLASDPDSSSRRPPSVRVPRGMMAALAEMNRLGKLPYDPARITTPTLVIQGEWDAVTPPGQGLWLFEHLASPSKRLVILSQGGHRLHLEQSRSQLYLEVRTFLLERVG
jgi:pimeloyl-ACP methyl ester carboxylesterase